MKNYYLKLIFSPFLYMLSFMSLYKYNIIITIIISLVFIFLIEFFTLTSYKANDYLMKLLSYVISFGVIYIIMSYLSVTRLQISVLSFYIILVENYLFLKIFYKEISV